MGSTQAPRPRAWASRAPLHSGSSSNRIPRGLGGAPPLACLELPHLCRTPFGLPICPWVKSLWETSEISGGLSSVIMVGCAEIWPVLLSLPLSAAQVSGPRSWTGRCTRARWWRCWTAGTAQWRCPSSKTWPPWPSVTLSPHRRSTRRWALSHTHTHTVTVGQKMLEAC